jgi:hypothetical protein
MGGLVALCLVATLLAGPALDAMVCRDDGDSHAVPAASSQAETLSAMDPSSRDNTSEPTVCAHGHCHHGVGFETPVTEIEAIDLPLSERHLLLASAQRASLSLSGLDRPPRA